MIRLLSVIALFTLVLADPAGSATIDLDWQLNTHHGTVMIDQGDTVRWTWQDSFGHTVTSTGGLFPSSSVITGFGMQYSVTFNTLGLFHYFCSPHGAGSMDGTIEVLPTSAVEGSSWARVKNLYR